jgi:SAM-dependent methyltransferase
MKGLEERLAEREVKEEAVSQRESLFLDAAIGKLCRFDHPEQIKVLDFGCGSGEMLRYLAPLGYVAWGCDISPHWEHKSPSGNEKFALISLAPYRLPYEDNTFDVVFSTSVFEHAQNKEACFQEIRRVLRPGGYGLHLFPSKWYLPSEPHIRIPLANYFWPHCPSWWIGLWVWLRVAIHPQLAPYRKSMTAKYIAFCEDGISYWPNWKFRQLSLKVFDNYSSPMDFYIANSGGGFARLARRLPFRKLSGWFSAQFRMNFIVQQKEA